MNGVMVSGSRDVHAAHEAMCTRYPAECDQLAYDAAAALLIGTGATCLGLVYAGSAATAVTYIADGVAALASEAMGAVTTAIAATSAGVATAASAAAAALPGCTAAGLSEMLVNIWWAWELWSWCTWEPQAALSNHFDRLLNTIIAVMKGAITVAVACPLLLLASHVPPPTTPILRIQKLLLLQVAIVVAWVIVAAPSPVRAIIVCAAVALLDIGTGATFLLLPPAVLVRQWARQGYLGHLGHLTGLWPREFVLERDCA